MHFTALFLALVAAALTAALPTSKDYGDEYPDPPRKMRLSLSFFPHGPPKDEQEEWLDGCEEVCVDDLGISSKTCSMLCQSALLKAILDAA
ncbi:hypothetical protein PG997_011951 [Apiospora hydei]|uniref:Uncharacterized protein n=1 Tax=Apiospora hydei TaxID=1337664 RepID=A0ABR1V1Z4_9PEZI